MSRGLAVQFLHDTPTLMDGDTDITGMAVDMPTGMGYRYSGITTITTMITAFMMTVTGGGACGRGMDGVCVAYTCAIIRNES